MTKLVRLRPKSYNQLKDDRSEDEKGKDTKISVIQKQRLKFEN